jgi:hypothetical protein
MKTILSFLAVALCVNAGFAQTKKLAISPSISATIQHAPGARTVQVLIPGVEVIELDLTQPGDAVFIIKTADYNFDGYKDFAFTSRDAAVPAAPTRYDIFLYHAEEKTFEPLEAEGGVCEGLSNVRVSVADKSLRSSCRAGTPKSSTDIYRWDSPFSLTLVKSIDNSAETMTEKAEEKADLKAEKAEGRKDAQDARKAAKEEDEEDEE